MIFNKQRFIEEKKREWLDDDNEDTSNFPDFLEQSLNEAITFAVDRMTDIIKNEEYDGHRLFTSEELKWIFEGIKK